MPKDPIQPAVFRRLRDDPAGRPWYFLSLRWKIALPLLALALGVSMLGAYLIIDRIADSVQQHEADRVRAAAQTVQTRMDELARLHQVQAQRITADLTGPAHRPLLRAGDGAALQPVLEALTAAEALDYVQLYGPDGREIVGLQRVTRIASGTPQTDYAVSDGTPLDDVLGGDALRPVIVRTPQGYALLAPAPVLAADESLGTLLVGTRLDRALVMLRAGDGTDLALFGGPEGALLARTLSSTVAPPDAWARVFDEPTTPPVERLTLNDQPYHAAYVPLAIDGTPLGVLGVYGADTTLYATDSSRTVISVLAAGAVALVVLVAFAVTGYFVGRLEHVNRTAHALAAGDRRARTRMQPGDEIGELGAALDRMAHRHARKTENLEQALRRQRRETARLNAVLESIPDGLVVQDLDGRVLMINQQARDLLGGQRVFRSSRLHELTAVVTEKLGPALAPGIYALGDPTRLPLDGKMLQAQAAAILTQSNTRIGTVIVLRDITQDVEREQAREALLDRLSEEAVAPGPPQSYDSLTALAQEVVRNTRSLQRVIAELRDVSTFEPRELQAGQRALPLNDLLWNIAAEWQPLVRSARMRLEVRFGPRGQHILGDNRRLRWAIGNLVDNALKYSPSGTVITLAGQTVDDDAQITVTDSGYGMTPEDQDNAFTRFYRGTPCDADGKPVRKPGTGQGLFITQRVIQAHGGTLALESRQGTGTTVTVRLPLTAPVTLEMPGAAGDMAAHAPIEPGDTIDPGVANEIHGKEP
jgi:PAS domain S-box-containing protein